MTYKINYYYLVLKYVLVFLKNMSLVYIQPYYYQKTIFRFKIKKISILI